MTKPFAPRAGGPVARVRARRTATTIVLGLCCLSASVPRAQAPGPATMVDMGGYELHVSVEGAARPGVPTVVFSSGLGSPLRLWSGLPSEIAQSAKTVAYDRAGIGASEPGLEAPTLEHIVDEMHELLARIDAPPPYVLVGHSLGGAIIHMFAAKHPDEVAGLVYIDPSDFMQTNADIDAIYDNSGVENAREVDREAGERAMAAAPAGVAAEAREFSKARQQGFVAYRAHGMAPDVPTVVLLAGMYQPPAPGVDAPVDPALVFERTLEQRLDHFGALVERMSDGVLVLTSMSGHFIHASEPELAAWAIGRVLAATTAHPELERFVGRYRVAQTALVFTITRHGDRLFSELAGQPRMPIFADSETSFSFRITDARIEFEVDDAGNATQLVLHQNGLRIPAAKVE